MTAKNADQRAALVPGTYRGEIAGSTSIVDENGAISGEKICYYVTIPFSKAIPYSAGDVIELAQDRHYTSLKNFRTVKLNGSKSIAIVNNKNVGNYAAFTYTATENGYFNAIRFENSTGPQSDTVKPLIYINDELVLGG